MGGRFLLLTMRPYALITKPRPTNLHGKGGIGELVASRQPQPEGRTHRGVLDKGRGHFKGCRLRERKIQR